jgi:hypothetical protein
VEYMALIYTDEDAEAAASASTRAAVLERYVAFAREARAAGVMVDGNELATTSEATTVRVREGEQLITDGPYAEAKEALGGYFVLDCASLDEAVAWAARIPGAEHGAVEIRPVHTGEG